MHWRRLLTTAHLALGLVAAPFLFALGGSGALLAFEQQLRDLLDARLTRVAPAGAPLPLDTVVARLAAAYPGAALAAVQPAPDATHAMLVTLAGAGPPRQLYVDPHDARVLGTDAEATAWLGTVHQLHTRLLAGPAGALAVACAAATLVVLALSGAVLWWPGRVLRVRRDVTRRRLVLDLHRALGGWAWLAMLLFGVTGAVVHWERPAQRALVALGATAPPRLPGESHACDGRPSRPLGALVAAAAARVPGAELRAVLLLGPAAGGWARLSFRYPEDRTPNGRSLVLVEPCTARVAFAVSTRGAPAAYTATRMWNRALHTGDVLGWPTRLLAAAASLALPGLALTGPAIWWTRRRRAARRGAVPRATPSLARGGTARALPVALLALQAPPSALVGEWRGESVCLARLGVCHDEVVVYRVSADPARAGALALTASKLVDGREEPMGTLACTADAAARVLTCPMPPQYPAGTWRFTRDGRTLAGGLTMADGAVVRRVRVTRTDGGAT